MEETPSATEPLAPAAPASAPTAFPGNAVPVRTSAALAPWYHALGIVLLLLVYAFVAHLTHRAPGTGGHPGAGQPDIAECVGETARVLADSPKVPLYCSTIMLSWMLLASVVAGLYRRRAFFVSALRRRFASRWTDGAIGLGIYLSFLTTLSMFVFLITAVLAFRAHARHPPRTLPQSSQGAQPEAGGDHTPAPSEVTDLENVQAVQRRVQRMLRFDQRAVASLAPRTAPQMLLWLVLSFTAAFCEEHIFRGYLLGQSLAFLGRFALPSWFAPTVSVLVTSVLFGSLHLYEGVGGAVVIAVLGAVFATMTLVLGNLRAVIVAHFLQDFIGGLTYYVAHLRHVV